MRMTLKQYGLEELVQTLEGIVQATPRIAKTSLYEGARVVADELRQAVETIPTEEHHAVPGAKNGYQLAYLTPEEKQACLDGIGVAKFDEEGGNYSTAVSFSGYMDIKTERYPNGVPVPVIMRSIEIGSSVRQKYPVCRKAFNKAKPSALEVMQKTVDEEISKLK